MSRFVFYDFGRWRLGLPIHAKKSEILGLNFLVIVCFLLSAISTPLSANKMQGLDEYLAYLSNRDQVEKVSEEIAQFEGSKKDEASKKIVEQKISLMKNNFEKTLGLLRKSSSLGFAPAQFAYAKYLRLQADASGNHEKKQQICELLNHAADSGLLVAAMSKGFYCSGISLRNNDAVLSEKMLKIIKDLEIAVAADDPFDIYYPFAPFEHVNCFEKGEMNTKADGDYLQKLIDIQPISLTLSQAKAEAFYQLALYALATDRNKSSEYLASAKREGCSTSAISMLVN